ncbi:MAG: adenosylcobinamide amidohydrolase [Candidatus Bathyarchaeota archaeon]|nr:adenosylcobinamide amidohydrolase [Candidatus Bathyarchaeum tardum]WGM88856.1 MAG: adenosylcobinamide amidohydrolase [Candidatus Bathyarchaeum tardum]WNZ28902.1 MAG: adenosylcobinamide amidohydrolase [Candidatus Bathyarchaeota archaeon]
MNRKEIKLNLENVKAEVLYHNYQNVDVNTLLVSFNQKRRVISTLEGYREVRHVANHYQPFELSKSTMKDYDAFAERFPGLLGLTHDDLTFLSTGANMNNLALCEKSFKDRTVCCLATGGVGNALRSGVDGANWIEQDGKYLTTLGTINIILLTNVTLTDGALARSIITGTEAKTAALQDMDARSSVSPQNQATGTGTDNMIVVSGTDPDKKVRHTGGHTKLGELIGASTKVAVAETIKKHDAWVARMKKA